MKIKAKDELNFHYYLEEDTGKWLLPQEICQLGGCDTKILEFDTEEEAHQAAEELTAEGKTTKVGFPCDECWKEYNA
jgi:hypothetical protein